MGNSAASVDRSLPVPLYPKVLRDEQYQYRPFSITLTVQFQSQAIKELFPSGGPVKTQIVGERNEGSVRQANRIKEFMNYQLTETMEEYTQ